jgi:hypothetical protein
MMRSSVGDIRRRPYHSYFNVTVHEVTETAGRSADTRSKRTAGSESYLLSGLRSTLRKGAVNGYIFTRRAPGTIE